MRKILIPALLFSLAACGGNDAPAPKNGGGSSARLSMPEAKRLYTKKCALCHGTDGKMMIGGAPDLSVSEMTLEERVAIITYGKGQMPPHNEVLSAAEIRGIATYIESFVE